MKIVNPYLLMQNLKLASIAILVSIPLLAFAQSNDDYLRYDIPSNAQTGGIFQSPLQGGDCREYYVFDKDTGRRNVVGIEVFERKNLIRRTPYLNGKKHGIEREWYANGKLKKETPYLNGLVNGTAKEWTEDGDLVGQYHMINGTGTQVVYYKDGHLKELHETRGGDRTGLVLTCFPNGNIKYLGHFLNDEVIGPDFAFYASGKLRYLGHSHGPVVEFDETGNVTNKAWMLKGKPTSEDQYREALKKDPSLVPYERDASQYKKEMNSDVRALIKKYHDMPLVKIPLQFDSKNNPIPAK